MKALPLNKTTIVKGLMISLAVTVCLMSATINTSYSADTAQSKVAVRVEADHDVLPAGKAQKTVVKVTLDAPPAKATKQRPPVNLAIVLDRSGSMTGTKIEKAKEAAIEAIRHLGSRDIFSLVVYDTNVNTIIPAQRGGYSELVKRKIRQIGPGGSTALFGGVSQGAAEVRKNLSSEYIHRIILLSDGLANVGPSTPEDLGRLGAALIKENISVTTIGVGTDYNEDLMAKLSQKSDGNTYFVESGRDLPRIFTAELGNVLNVVAKKVEVIVEIPNGMRPVSIIGREGRIKGQTVVFSMNQLYGDQEKYALVEVEIPETKADTRLQLASANVKYVNPYTNLTENAIGSTDAWFSKSRKKVKRSENVSVLKEYQLMTNALAEEKAISLSDKGMKQEAVQTLKQSAAKLKAFGSTYKDDAVLKEAEALEAQADTIEKQGMSKKSRKILRTKSYQQKNQQMNY